ncbi:molybdopterin-binding protein [Ferviditalea candida]|uniref:Molybdopterin molybdenumtransferase n=1 Tax=Ferviditalea candida TaxID=3108399 RepID=A0ABU5ZEJ7_9BACL|nr:molybdopterin-binding protein [Paenibacillaceae bacterium T2]
MKNSRMLREVNVHDAVGMVLAHDLTQIIPGKFKGRLFKKGHVIREEDIEHLLNIGKEHIYILSLEEGYLHEDEAAERMAAAIRGDHLELTQPHEGKVTIKSAIHGLAKIDKAFVDAVNSMDQIVMSTIKTNTPVEPGKSLIGTRVIPLIVENAKISKIERLALEWKKEHPDEQIVTVKPFQKLKVGLITTGGEVFSGRIQDKFGPTVRDKLAKFGSEVVEQRYSPDDSDNIVREIRYFAERETIDMILVTGGMSVDPDDRTPGAIAKAGADIVSYGTPMLPGSMLLMSYLTVKDRTIPVMGLPGCVMHDPFTSFDVLLPRICAGERIERRDITEMGYGGLLG